MPTQLSQSNIPLKPFYTPDDTCGLDYATTLQDPGAYPYTRGRRVGAAPGGTWIQRELSGEGPPSRSNAQFRYLIDKGALGLDVIGDAPTVACLDPDHPFARHAVGTQGVSLCRLQDYAELYDGIPLERVTLSHSLPAAFAIAGLYRVAETRGIDPAVLRGSVIQAPFYCEDYGYATHMPFALRMRLALDSIAFCTTAMPKFHAFVEDTYYISDGGPDAVEEMALGFVELRHLVRKLLEGGLAIDSFAPRIAILVNCRMDVFEEVAKIRATRRLFARMMREEFGARDPRSWSANITAHTAGSSLTAQQPINNVVRGTIQALALAMAGVQAMEISAFDEAFRTPSPAAHLVGLRTQQVVQLESNVTTVADPLGGSYYVESLTNEIERRIREMVTHIEAQGEPATLCDQGWFRRVFEAAMQRNARAIQDGTLPRVGVNVFQMPADQDTLLREVAETKIEPCREHVAHIAAFKQARDARLVRHALRTVHATAKAPGANVMPAIVAALDAGTTMGEIAGALRVAYGVAYDPFGALPPVCSFDGAA